MAALRTLVSVVRGIRERLPAEALVRYLPVAHDPDFDRVRNLAARPDRLARGVQNLIVMRRRVRIHG
jgi:hypothetical protein